MDEEIAAIRSEISQLEGALDQKLKQRKSQIAFKMEGRKVVFEEAVEQEHREAKSSVVAYFLNLPFRTHITAPLVYAMIIPFAFLDLWVVIFQKICFWAWDLPRARRADYVVIDRQYLQYLNGIEKLNCVFCGYANGVIAFTREVAGRTEKYWCPIKHARKVNEPHPHYGDFTEFGDAEAWQKVSKLPAKDDS